MAAPLSFVNPIYSSTATLTGSGTARAITTSMDRAGNFLACWLSWASNTITLTSVTDSQSNTWTIIQTITAGNSRGALVVCYAPKRLIATIDTVTFTFSAGVNHIAQVAEFVGVKATGTPTDGSSTNTGTGSAPSYTSNNATTANANDLLLGMYFQDTTAILTITPGSSFTAVSARLQFTSGGAMQAHYRVVSATGSYANTGTTTTGGNSVGWGAGVWAFKQSDTSAPQVSQESAEVASIVRSARLSTEAAEVASAVTSARVTSEVAEVASAVTSARATFVGLEIAYTRAGNVAVTSVAAEVSFTRVPLARRVAPQIVG